MHELSCLLRYHNWRRIASALERGGVVWGGGPWRWLFCLAAGVPGVMWASAGLSGAGRVILILAIGACLFVALEFLRRAAWRELHALAEQTGGKLVAQNTGAAQAGALAAEVGGYNERVGVACLHKTPRAIEGEIMHLYGRWAAIDAAGFNAAGPARWRLRPARLPSLVGATYGVLLAGVAAGFVLSELLATAPADHPPAIARVMPAPSLAPFTRPRRAPGRSPWTAPRRRPTPRRWPTRRPWLSHPPRRRTDGGQHPLADGPAAPDEGEVRAFLRRQFETEQSRHLDQILAGYASTVDYYDHPGASQDYIRADKQSYYDRWPVGREQTGDVIRVTAVDSDRAWQAQFTTDFYVESSKRQEWIKGRTQEVYTVQLIDGQPKITVIKSNVVQREKGHLAAPTAMATAPAAPVATPPRLPGNTWEHREITSLQLATVDNRSTISFNGNAFTYFRYTTSTLRPGVAQFAPGKFTIPPGVRQYSYVSRFRGEVIERQPNFVKLRIDSVDFPQRSLKGMALEKVSDDNAALGKKWSFNIAPNGDLVDATDAACVFTPSR